MTRAPTTTARAASVRCLRVPWSNAMFRTIDGRSDSGVRPVEGARRTPAGVDHGARWAGGGGSGCLRVDDDRGRLREGGWRRRAHPPAPRSFPTRRRPMSSPFRYTTPSPPKSATGRVAGVYAQLADDFGIERAVTFVVLSPAPGLMASAWALMRESLIAGEGSRTGKE